MANMLMISRHAKGSSWHGTEWANIQLVFRGSIARCPFAMTAIYALTKKYNEPGKMLSCDKVEEILADLQGV